MTEHTSTGLTGSANSHARLSPSDSKRWTTCSASIAFQEANAHRVRKDNGSSWSDEGTEAHEACAEVLLGRLSIDDVPETGMLGNDLRTHVASYVEHCMELFKEDELGTIDDVLTSSYIGMEAPDRVFFVEEQVALFYQEEQTGTADFLGIIAEDNVVKRFVGRDLKFGAGVLVTSDLNTQLAIYIYSAIMKLKDVYQFDDDTLVDLHVFMPRHREGMDQAPWVLRFADLRAFCTGNTESIEYRAIQAREGANRVRAKIGAPGRDVSPEEILEAAPGVAFYPQEGDGGSCRWCKCKAFCPKRLEAATEDMDREEIDAASLLAAMPDLDDEQKGEPVIARLMHRFAACNLLFIDNGCVIPDAYLVTLYRNKKAINSLLNDVEEYLEGRALDGDAIPGTKLVDGRQGNREWADLKAADTFLANQDLSADQRYKPREVVSVAVAEKLLKGRKLSTKAKNRWEQLVTRSSGKKKLALAEDDREAVPAAVHVMPDLDDQSAFE